MSTYSVDSTIGDVGIIINPQFVRMVLMITNEKSGCTKIQIATRRIGLNGSSNHIAFDAEKRKMSFPLLTTTNVCKRERRILLKKEMIEMGTEYLIKLGHEFKSLVILIDISTTHLSERCENPFFPNFDRL